jgi:heptosyltransferase II
MEKILVIQTSFIGDVILATAILEKLHRFYPSAKLDIVVRKGNESLFEAHPFIHDVLVWNKKEAKWKNLWQLAKKIKQSDYDLVINLHRFASSGLLTVLSGASQKIGFTKNPFSRFFTKKVQHHISSSGTMHEIERNQVLIKDLTDEHSVKPKLYPSEKHIAQARKIYGEKKFITISPASVWFTKQLPKEKWIELIEAMPTDKQIFILGGLGDRALGDEIASISKKDNIRNLCGELSLLGSAALMQGAEMNYVNDSAPLHLCSAMNAPLTAFFCSTVPAFGFTPLSDVSIILETDQKLACRPCGLHGYKTCPKGHFKCGQIPLSYQ